MALSDSEYGSQKRLGPEEAGGKLGLQGVRALQDVVQSKRDTLSGLDEASEPSHKKNSVTLGRLVIQY